MQRIAASILTATLAAVVIAHAADTPVPADPDLPHGFDPAGAQQLLVNSPFTRALNLSDSLVLTGIAYIKGKPIVTVMNKLTKESYVVSDEPNASGWKLAQSNLSISLTRAQAKITIGGETVTVRYNDSAITPDSLKKGGFKPGGGDAEDKGKAEDQHPHHGYGRPSQQDMDRFKNLSDTAKGRFISAMMESRERMANATDEERNNYRQTVFNRIEQEDGKGSAK